MIHDGIINVSPMLFFGSVDIDTEGSAVAVQKGYIPQNLDDIYNTDPCSSQRETYYSAKRATSATL